MLAVVVRVRVDGEPPRDDLAVRGDAVGRIGADDVDAGAAVDAVDAAERGLHAVGAAAGEHRSGAWRADDQLAALRAVDRRRGRGRGEREEQEDGEESAHRGRPEYPRRAGERSGGRLRPTRALGENLRALAADLALELVGDAGPLHDDVGADGAMPVGQPQDAKRPCHFHSQSNKTSVGRECQKG